MKKITRKLLALGLAGAMALSLAACGGSSSSSSSSASGKPTGSDGYDITYIVTDDSGYLNNLWHDAVETADALDVNLDVRYAGEDSNKVLDCIAQAKAAGKDAVILNIVNSEDAEGCLEAAGRNLKFDCIISNNDEMAIGAVTAMKDHGLDPADYTIVGIDGLPDALAAIEKGEMKMSVYQNSKGQADGAIRAAKNMIDGKEITDGTDYSVSEESQYLIYVPFEEITAANVKDYK